MSASQQTELKNQVDSLRNDLPSIKTNIDWIIKIGGSAIGIAIIAGSFFFHELMQIGERISTLEGKGGSIPATEKALQESKTPAELTANLNLLQAQVQKRSVSNDPLNDVELRHVGVAINAAVNSHPNVPAVWNVSSQFVNFRFDSSNKQLSSTNLPNCWTTFRGRTIDPNLFTGPPPIIDDQKMGNCELTLDDDARFRDSGFGKAYESNLLIAPNLRLRFLVHDAVVTYSGTKLIPFAGLVCIRCVFKIGVHQQPMPAGKKVVQELLTALSAGEVQLSDSSS